MRALLDVNVLIALLDGGHEFNRLATDWLEAHLDRGWASCPLTENGCIRVMSQPRYPGALPSSEVAERLSEATRDPSHEFWAADTSLLESGRVDWGRLSGHRQITDAYLLSLAVVHSGALVTFDRRIGREVVPAAGPEHLVIIPHH
ncbi:MAG: PIN domain-containing protein [Halorhodospira halophila]|uniref:TA system VapC family ribonuclease toxin n=1 Tax=Halorhodospira TaxID=85108 RepID=UPI001EE7AF42|nr:TA system VapC family ribonuclease toxin [Halorhodospira halophila]MCC3751429.1 PIN domain-containing protein [Halorhodospira halophila]MCG5528520.1 PIN domain-containing protein [Halorhodospira halophila]MCG5537455.1 PIN domain-containing protein [Halorhodospira sp. 9622]MCG5543817.1 PIN domain-containing protein [Halorhodospira sp. 9628]